MVSERYQQL